MLCGAVRSVVARVGGAVSRIQSSTALLPSVSPASASLALYSRSASPIFASQRARRAFATKSDDDSGLPEVKEGKPGEIPSIFDQATGLERAEIENPDLFKHNDVIRGPFGTAENPVLIKSNFDARIVGCTGRAAPDDHDLYWINVEKDVPATCSRCGQVFKLDPL